MCILEQHSKGGQLDNHWRPQYIQNGACDVSYTHVGKNTNTQYQDEWLYVYNISMSVCIFARILCLHACVRCL